MISLVSILLVVFSSCISTFASSKDSATRSIYLRQDKDLNKVIVFVHGVLGNGFSTWFNKESKAYWPQLLKEDNHFSKANIYVFEYPTPAVERSFSIDELADHMRLVLKSSEVLKHPEIIFLVHSMGGLVTRAFLLKYREYADKVGFIYFFATPTSGSPTATLAKIVSGNPQLGKMTPMKSDGYLANGQRQWLASPQLTQLPSYCAYEMKNTFGLKVVEQQSATHLCNRPIDPIDRNHIDIVKPLGPNDTSYIAFKSAYMENISTELKSSKNEELIEKKAEQNINVGGNIYNIENLVINNIIKKQEEFSNKEKNDFNEMKKVQEEQENHPGIMGLRDGHFMILNTEQIQLPKKWKVQWTTGSIDNFDSKVIDFTFPNIDIDGFVVTNLSTQLKNEIGQTTILIDYHQTLIVAEVVKTNKNFVILAFRFLGSKEYENLRRKNALK